MKLRALQLSLALLLPAGAWISPFGIQGMGLELPAANGREMAMGNAGLASTRLIAPSPANPSRSAFQPKTSFQALFEADADQLDDGASTTLSPTSRLAFLGMNFAAGWAGNLGLVFHQRFEKNFQLDAAGAVSPSMLYAGGAGEVAVTWARRLGRENAAAVGWHFFIGSDRLIRQVDFGDPGLVPLGGDTLVTRWPGSYPTLSFTHLGDGWSAAADVSLPFAEFDRHTERKTGAEITPPETRTSLHVPMRAALGVAWQPQAGRELVMDFSTTDWDQRIDPDLERSFRVGGGYELQGQGGDYDPYWRRMAYRLGAGWERLSAEGVHAGAVTLGLGMPLGKRKNFFDLALEVGRRGAVDTDGVQETYLKVALGFTGFGNWGEASRKKK